jgi:hypothetical protein
MLITVPLTQGVDLEQSRLDTPVRVKTLSDALIVLSWILAPQEQDEAHDMRAGIGLTRD